MRVVLTTRAELNDEQRQWRQRIRDEGKAWHVAEVCPQCHGAIPAQRAAAKPCRCDDPESVRLRKLFGSFTRMTWPTVHADELFPRHGLAAFSQATDYGEAKYRFNPEGA